MLSENRGTAKWSGAHYNQEVRFRLVQQLSERKDPKVIASLLNKRRNYYYYYYYYLDPGKTSYDKIRSDLFWVPSYLGFKGNVPKTMEIINIKCIMQQFNSPV